MFGLREFQLALLHQMYDEAAAQTEQALRTLGATRAEASSASSEWAKLGSQRVYGNFVRTSDMNVHDYTTILGPPVSTELIAIGNSRFHAFRWELHVWPDPWFEVQEAQDGSTWNNRLTRRTGAAQPELRHIEDMTPWSYVSDEVERTFAPIENIDGMPYGWWVSTFVSPNSAGSPTQYAACFVWGLLQNVREFGDYVSTRK